MTGMLTSQTDSGIAAVEDMSAWLMAGRVTAQNVAAGIDDAVEAERLGFNRVFLSERYNLKEAGVILGGVAARTSRLGVGTGVIAVRSRHPLMTAAMGATLHAAYGPRFVLGIGRSEPMWVPGEDRVTFQELIDYVAIVRRLWAGETVTYNGPAGHYEGLALGDRYEGVPPQVWVGSMGGPKAAAAAANPVFDGVMLWPMFTPEATRKAANRLRGACERSGRDPSSLRICQPVVTAPDLSDEQTRAVAHARLVTYITWPNGHAYAELNGWDRDTIEQVRNHAQFVDMAAATPDYSFHREQLAEPAKLVPDQWMLDSCAIGSVSDCVAKLEDFREAGADELATYGTTALQNADLLRAWRATRVVEPGSAL
jgi:probable F420-dependent oxidoreductase